MDIKTGRVRAALLNCNVINSIKRDYLLIEALPFPNPKARTTFTFWRNSGQFLRFKYVASVFLTCIPLRLLLFSVSRSRSTNLQKSVHSLGSSSASGRSNSTLQGFLIGVTNTENYVNHTFLRVNSIYSGTRIALPLSQWYNVLSAVLLASCQHPYYGYVIYLISGVKKPFDHRNAAPLSWRYWFCYRILST